MHLRLCITILLFLQLSLYLEASNILYYNQDCNFDLAGADNSCSDERYNLLNIIQNDGHQVNLLTDFHQANLPTLLEQHDLLMIPDIEDAFDNCDVSDVGFINSSEKLTLKNYIESGGSLLIAGSAQNIDFLNDVFGLGLIDAGNATSGYAYKNATQAQGTPYDSCIDSIPNLSATFLVSTSMPTSKQCIYEKDGNAALAFFTVGSGSITYLGYDFNDAGPGCGQSASVWAGCIVENSVIVADSGINTVTVPTLSQWGLISLLLCLMIFATIAIKQSTTIRPLGIV